MIQVVEIVLAQLFQLLKQVRCMHMYSNHIFGCILSRIFSGLGTSFANCTCIITIFFCMHNHYFFLAEPPVGYFWVRFMQKTASRYRNEFSFRGGLFQEEIVIRCIQDPDRMNEAQGLLEDQPNYRVFEIKSP